MSDSAYARAGVSIDSGNRAVAGMADAVRSTYGPEVLAGLGAFGGLFDASALKGMQSPVLVASTDGVGTKTKVAAKLGRWDTVGQDLVNHCVNDILVQGARPLFFLDYVASSALDPDQIATIVGGMATACRAIGCALLGGETAEMPGVYERGEVDIVGTIIGAVDRGAIIDGSTITEGDVLIGLPSTGLHTNGYSLARRVLERYDWNETPEGFGASLSEALLAVHRCYVPEAQALRSAGIELRGLAHITGGGMVENLPRILPESIQAVIHRGTWTEPPLFGLIQDAGNVSDEEMFRVFNMGLGMIAVIPAAQRDAALGVVPDAVVIGGIASGPKSAVIV